MEESTTEMVTTSRDAWQIERADLAGQIRVGSFILRSTPLALFPKLTLTTKPHRAPLSIYGLLGRFTRLV